MNRTTDGSKALEPLPKARIKKSQFAWLIWGFPVAAAAFLGYLVLHDHADKSRMITVYFQTVDGVDAGNTQVKCRGAMVGIVKTVSLTPDQKWVELGVVFKEGQENLARQGALFWVVKPELGAGMVSGLQTVMSGSYLEVRPGDGGPTNFFMGSPTVPTVELPERALEIVLLAPSLSGLQPASPIFYRGIQAGEVTDFQLGPDAQEVVVHARIREPYAPLVRKDSVFWNAGGIDFNFSLLHGASLSADSAKALIAGAVEFATPEDLQDVAPRGTTFRLFEKPMPEWKEWRPKIPLKLPEQADQDGAVSGKNLPQTTLHK